MDLRDRSQDRRTLRQPPTGKWGYHGFVALERAGTPRPGVVCVYRVISSYDSMLLAIAALNEVATYDQAEAPRWPTVTPGLDTFATGYVLRPIAGTPAHGRFAVVYWPEPKDAGLKVPIAGGVVDLTLARRTFEHVAIASLEAIEAAQGRAARGELSPREKEANADAELCACGARKDDHPKVGIAANGCRTFRGTDKWPPGHKPTSILPEQDAEVQAAPESPFDLCVCTFQRREHDTPVKDSRVCDRFNLVTVTTLSPPADRPAHLRAQDAAMGRALDRGREERELDATFANPYATHARPGAFKSWIALEEWGHTAHLKLDYDTKHERPERRNEPRAGEWQAVFAELGRGRIQVHTHQGQPFERCIPHQAAELRAYATNRGLHVRVWLRTIDVLGKGTPCQLTDAHLLQLHARLNDDPVRQQFNAKRVARGAVGWLVLWTRKIVVNRVVSQEVYSEEWTKRIRGWIAGTGDER